MTDSRLVVALDFNSSEKCLELVKKLDPSYCRLKIGKELFTLAGPELIKTIQEQGFDIFLDLKFHDIPNTVAKAVSAAAELGVWMVNVHASGGARMLHAAQEALKAYQSPPLLIGVTVLTSMDENDLAGLGIHSSVEEQVLRYSKLVKENGLSGVVCSAREASLLKREFGDEFVTVTPGIRPANTEVADQKRVMTPAEAITNGSDYLVIGRPITQSDNPLSATRKIYDEIEQARADIK